LTNSHKVYIFPSAISNQQSPINNEPGLYISIINQQSSIVNEMGGGADRINIRAQRCHMQGKGNGFSI
jgi:hypothetical protein